MHTKCLGMKLQLHYYADTKFTQLHANFACLEQSTSILTILPATPVNAQISPPTPPVLYPMNWCLMGHGETVTTHQGGPLRNLKASDYYKCSRKKQDPQGMHG